MNNPARRLRGSESQLVTNPASSESIPRNMIGPRTKPPARFAATATSDVEPKASIETGAVARLAAVVTAACSAIAPGRKRRAPVSGRENSRRPATAANESWKLTSNRLLGLTVSSQAPGMSQTSQPSAGREARTATSPAMPAMPARTIDGEAPVSST